MLHACVEGFLECQRKNTKSAANFSRSDDWYVTQISHWYGVKEDDPGKIIPKRGGKKIADVLYLYKDKAGSRTPTAKKPKSLLRN